MSSPVGLYIHVPFCVGKCPYCDFYSLKGTGVAMDSYIGAVLRSVKQYEPSLKDGADTLYFGGGTPSLLGAERFTMLLQDLMAYLLPQAEITVECNPAGDLETLLPCLAANGVNRVSLGMQSAVDTERKILGRRADQRRIRQALFLCRENGITNVSLDLMLGIPHMTMTSLDLTLDFIEQSGVPHISAYLLKIEPGTPFANAQATLELPEEDLVCSQYLHTVERLEAMGLAQYEISNFAKPGYESRHNLKYWHCEEYLGIGPSAHSFLHGRRFYYPRDLTLFAQNCTPIPDGGGGDKTERLMLALRLTEGIALTELTPEAQQKAVLFREKGLLLQKGAHIAMTPAGFLLSNTIIGELLMDAND